MLEDAVCYRGTPQETHPLRVTKWPLLQEQLAAERQWPDRLAHFLKQFSQSQSVLRGGEEVVPLLCQSIDWSCNAIQPTVKTVFEWCRTMNKNVVCL